MTGIVEAASLSLAVIPIVISVAEHYSSAARALNRYRQFSSEIRRLLIFVKIQRTRYYCEIQSLLSHCVGLERAELLLGDTDNAQWKDGGLEALFATKLGSYREPFMELVEHINVELSEMEANLGTFEEVAQLKDKGDAQNERRWRHDIKEKCRFVFYKSQLQESKRSLGELMDCFATVISHTETNEQRRLLSRPSIQARQAMDHFALVQTASQNLYDALKSACTKHIHHQAQFSLQPIPGRQAHQIRFSVGFGQVVPPACRSKQMAWFTVESIIRQSTESCPSEPDPGVLSTLRQSIIRERESSPPALQNKPSELRKKCLRFQLPPSPLYPPLSKASVSSSEPMIESPLLNLCSRSNFCNQLQNFSSRPVPQAECCIGYLERSSESKHLIYLKEPEAEHEHHIDVPSCSLAKLLSQHRAGSDEASGIAQCERLRLSKQLATAVLQFYSTPWLRNSWSSGDVLFRLQSASPTGQIQDLKEPYLDVSIWDSKFAPSSTTCYPFAPNDFLFGLGVMLLELAFQKPLRSMQQSCDVANSQDERHTLYFTAKRMSRLVSRESGTRYGEIVRKCLACDFGRGDDLSKPALQEGVYQEVVCELTALEELLRAMDIGC